MFLILAYCELLGVASPLLHRIHSAGGILCLEHVCGSRGGELPPLSGRAGEGRESKKGSQKATTDGEEEAK